MIAYLEELLGRLFGAEQHAPIPVPVEDNRKSDRFVRPTRGDK